MRLLKVVSKKYNDKDVLEVENFVYEVGNLTSLTSAEVEKLQCGDIVCKKDSTGLHAYLVSFKKDGTGICLTYCDGSGYMETVSYDYTGGQWVYNSTDVTQAQEKLVSGANIKTVNSQSLLGSGNINIGGGTQLYKHNISILGVKMSGSSDNTKKDIRVNIISTSSTPITSISSFVDLLDLEVCHTDFTISDLDYAEEFSKIYVFAIRDGDTYEGYSFKENNNYRVSVDIVESVYDELHDNVTPL